MRWGIFANQSSADNAQKMKISIKDFFSKCDQIRRKLQMWSHLLKKFLVEIFFFCVQSETLFEWKIDEFDQSNSLFWQNNKYLSINGLSI